VEEQAIDRLYRIGQKEKVQVVKYCVANSIEANIFQIKRKKAELAM
jgi:SNF2 family DNA or RNA helicase